MLAYLRLQIRVYAVQLGMQVCRLVPSSCAFARSVTLVKEKGGVCRHKVEALCQLSSGGGEGVVFYHVMHSSQNEDFLIHIHINATLTRHMSARLCARAHTQVFSVCAHTELSTQTQVPASSNNA